jgi:hypothetical protein
MSVVDNQQVYRGGKWYPYGQSLARVGNYGISVPTINDIVIGFRLVVDSGTERRMARGGFYPFDSHEVRDSVQPEVGKRCRYLGIRLAREGT